LFAQDLGYYKSVELNAAVGGDNCSRSMLVGSVLGASDPAGITEEWKAKTAWFDRVHKAAQLLVSKRAK
jgi:hypothetical protein